MIRELTLPQFVEQLKNAAPRMQAAARRGALSGALRCVAVVQKATREAVGAKPGSGPVPGGAVNTGNFLRSWKTRQTSRGALLFNNAPYSGVIEGGRRPGSRMPPRAPIQRWAERKLGLSESEARSAAFVIARSVANRGLQARKVMDGVLKQSGQIVAEEVLREIRHTLEGGVHG